MSDEYGPVEQPYLGQKPDYDYNWGSNSGPSYDLNSSSYNLGGNKQQQSQGFGNYSGGLGYDSLTSYQGTVGGNNLSAYG